jgi:hypothetical protein
MSYFPLLLSNLTYDQICHEHVAYYTLTSFNKIVENKDRKGAGPSVLASGLYLSKVEYPSSIYI